MRVYRDILNSRQIHIGFLASVIVLIILGVSQAQTQKPHYCVAAEHADYLYCTGFQAYERDDLVTAHQLLSFYYLLTVNSGDIQRNQPFMKRIIDANNYLNARLRELIEENASLSNQLEDCRSRQLGGIGQKRSAIKSPPPKPSLPNNPPTLR